MPGEKNRHFGSIRKLPLGHYQALPKTRRQAAFGSEHLRAKVRPSLAERTPGGWQEGQASLRASNGGEGVSPAARDLYDGCR
jgi:hypothetical protein